MAKKVALINMKGGVGKSTLAVQLAWYFALPQDSKRVLLIDLDPQFNASQYLLGHTAYRRTLEEGQRTVWDLFEQNAKIPGFDGGRFDPHEAIYTRWSSSSGGQIDIILSRLELAFSLKTPFHQKEQELSRAISAVESEYDLVLIDCAPTESLRTTAAYLSSDYLLVPVKPEYLSAIGLPLLVQSMQDFKGSYGARPLKLAGVVFTATTNYSPEEHLAKTEVRKVARQNRWHVFDHEVPYSRSYARSARLGRSIFSTPNARSAQKARFAQFAGAFARRIRL